MEMITPFQRQISEVISNTKENKKREEAIAEAGTTATTKR